jgi:hypothetical protein
LDTDFDAYRVINIKEKEGFKFEIGGLTYAGPLEAINGPVQVPVHTVYMLTVHSTPYENVWVEVLEADRDSLGSGMTPFTRIYDEDTVVHLTVGGTNGPAFTYPWRQWNKDDALDTDNVATSVTMDDNHLLVAIFEQPVVTASFYTLTVTATSTLGGPNLELAVVATDPEGENVFDLDGLGSRGVTPFTRRYLAGQPVVISASMSYQYAPVSWEENAVVLGTDIVVSIVMNSDHTVNAAFDE